MKQVIIVVAFSLLGLMGYAQKQNDKGLYVDNDGKLLSAVISSLNNGIRSELTILNGVAEGAANYYDEAGNLIESGSFTNGQKHDKWIRYNANKSVSAIAFYNAGKKHGTWSVFDENGIKRMEMTYANGEKTGIWYTFDENGTIASSKSYERSSN